MKSEFLIISSKQPSKYWIIRPVNIKFRVVGIKFATPGSYPGMGPNLCLFHDLQDLHLQILGCFEEVILRGF
jgi:hypothetical protein